MGTLQDTMKTFSKMTSFREIYKKFIYIDCRELLDIMLPGEIDDDITGMFVYCYIDQKEGLSFRPFLLAAMRGDDIQVFSFPHQEDTIYILRLREGKEKMDELHNHGRHMYLYSVNPEKYSFFDLELLDIDTEAFEDIRKFVDDNYHASDMVIEFRTDDKWKFLDKYRNLSFPDDVQALLYSENNGIEQVWVRLTFMTDNDEIFGELLNEPYKDYGCHEGTLIELAEVDTGDNKALVFTGRIARRG